MIFSEKYRLFINGVRTEIQDNGLIQKEVAVAIGQTPGNFSSYLNLRTKMPDHVIKKLTKHLGKTYDQFVEIGLDIREFQDNYFPSHPVDIDSLAKSLSKFYESSKGQYSTIQLPHRLQIVFGTQNKTEQQNIDEDHFIAVPVYESQKPAMGNHGLESDQTQKAASYIIIFRPELKHRVKHRLIAFRVRDDAMAPLIPQDSIIVVDTDDREFVDNKIFGIALDEKDEKPEYSITAKRVRKLKETSGFLLLSENQDHTPKQINEATWERQCIGRVVWMWRSFDD